jgi:GDP-4-dehydro-6-deoxy-D-mannose reductase
MHCHARLQPHGPASRQVFATSSFAKQIAEIEAGKRRPVIDVGDLDSRRDWTDTRDMVRGYWLATERGQPGEVYNVGQGTCIAVGEMLDILLSHSHVKIAKEQDPSRLRPSDVQLLWANVDKFKKATDWEPMIPFDQTMADLLDYWRERVRVLGMQPVGTR